ncbi:unnamed protein product [Phaedon cochleariae]|uniref:Reverse transcriptase n=1 Tax=Phaedon cochleariae TaxID=80249 RepID=A0A9N9SKR0_PHACE|nr:unnamed protein product [Phaedon cochleariae]
MFGLQNPRVTGQILRSADRLIKRFAKHILHLNEHTPDAKLHAKIRDGGLGFLDLRHFIPGFFLISLTGLLDHVDGRSLSAVLQCVETRRLIERLNTLKGDVPNDHLWRDRLMQAPTLEGLENCTDDPASRSWIDQKPAGWTGQDFVRAVQLRSNNLTVAGIMSKPPELRKCRAGCDKVESLSHVLQQCPATHWERIRRHNEVVKKVAGHCRKKQWTTEEEPHVQHQDGTLLKPDLVVHQNIRTLVVDVGVNWEGNQPLGVTYAAKRAVYHNNKFSEAARQRWPGKTLQVLPLIVGARGIWPRCNGPTDETLKLTRALRASCVHIALKWGSSIHQSFGRRVWRWR